MSYLAKGTVRDKVWSWPPYLLLFMGLLSCPILLRYLVSEVKVGMLLYGSKALVLLMCFVPFCAWEEAEVKGL